MDVRLRLRVHPNRLRRSSLVPDRKQSLTFSLVAVPVALYWHVGEHWAIGLLTVGIGVLLSTDYQIVDEYVSRRAYEWIHDTETLLEAVEQNYHAAQYAAKNYEPFELSYWRDGHFRATVPSERPIRPGIRFLILCTVTAQDDRLTYPMPFCTAEVESVSAESNGMCEVKMNLVRWLDEYHTGNEPDRAVYREITQKLRTGSDDLSPRADIDESTEMNTLDPDEWKTLHELLAQTELHEGR